MNEEKHQGHYIHHVTYTYRERLVGAFVLTAALALLFLMAINVSVTRIFEERVSYHAYLNDGKGIDSDTLVKVSGIEAGRVSSLEITQDNKVHVEIYVYERFHERIRSNASATLNRLSMLGVPTIDIAPGSVDLPVLADGATIDIRETLSVEQIMEGLATLLYQADTATNASAFANLAQTAENLKVITSHVREGKGAAGMFLYDEDFSAGLVSTVESLQAALATATERLEQVKPVLGESKQLVASLRTATSEIPALVSEVRDSVAEARHVLSVLNRELERFPDFMVRADLLIRDTAEVIDALERTWPVSSALQRAQDDALVEPQVAHD